MGAGIRDPLAGVIPSAPAQLPARGFLVVDVRVCGIRRTFTPEARSCRTNRDGCKAWPSGINYRLKWRKWRTISADAEPFPLGNKWPSMRGRALRRIIEKHCGSPIRHGKHPFYQGKTKRFAYGYHDNDDVTGNQVRRILIEDVGLTEDEAREEVS
jgi:hypothetical protein